MTLHRSFARLTALSFAAATLAACGGDSTSPLDLQPVEFEALGETVAYEIEAAVAQLTADGAYLETETPAFMMGSRTSQHILGPAAKNVVPMRQAMGEECGVPSQNPPVDSDEDGVPDNLSIHFALPACHIVTEDGSMDITGLFRISDPQPANAGMGLTFSLDNFRVAFSSPEFSGNVVRDGGATVSATAQGLSQTIDWSEAISVKGFPGLSANIDWTATFAAAQGQEIVPNQPLPDGAYTPGGTFVYREGRRQSAFSVTTLETLQYSAECAAGVAQGMVDSPFMSGTLRIGFSGQEGRGYVVVTYADCGWAQATYHAVSAQ